jgi:Uma2 family endonuclease
MAASMHENALLDRLLKSPRLPMYAVRIDALLAEEAQRRQAFYETMREGDKTEFINGETIVHSPVKLRHNATAKRLLVLLDAFVSLRQLGYVGYEKILIVLTRNDYQPDICFFGADKSLHFQPDQMRFPAPDFVVEVLSASTEAVDRGLKLEDYAAHGVAEYWIVDPEKEMVEQYLLAGDEYELAIKAQTGELHCTVISHFMIPVRAIFDDDINRATLRQLLDTEA